MIRIINIYAIFLALSLFYNCGERDSDLSTPENTMQTYYNGYISKDSVLMFKCSEYDRRYPNREKFDIAKYEIIDKKTITYYYNDTLRGKSEIWIKEYFDDNNSSVVYYRLDLKLGLWYIVERYPLDEDNEPQGDLR